MVNGWQFLLVEVGVGLLSVVVVYGGVRTHGRFSQVAVAGYRGLV